jgi:hypothetical protein
VLFVLDYLYSGGISEVRDLAILAPRVELIAVPVAAIALLRSRLRDVGQRVRGWPFAIIVLLFFFLTIIIGLVQPELEYSTLYNSWYETFRINGFEATWGLTALFMVRIFIRQITFRNIVSTWLGFVAVTSLLGFTPFADIVFPALGEFTRWIAAYPSSTTDLAFYWGIILAIMILFVNMILGRERLRPPVQ